MTERAISVLIPTWQRPRELMRCLASLARQTKAATQVIVTVRHDDVASARAIECAGSDPLPAALQIVRVDPGPLTSAMNAGLRCTRGDLVALTDDDAEPPADWLARLDACFTDPEIAGVGGRDRIPGQSNPHAERVGRVAWYGRVIGNHHLGVGAARDVDLLKGVNCCFRGDLLRQIGFDRRLRGHGNVSHWEMSLCFQIRRAGHRLVYDPSIVVEHHVAARRDGDVNARGGFEALSFSDAAFNQTLAVLEHLPSVARRRVFQTWAEMVGTRELPGLTQVLRSFGRSRERTSALARWRASRAGRRLALRAFRNAVNSSGSAFP